MKELTGVAAEGSAEGDGAGTLVGRRETPESPVSPTIFLEVVANDPPEEEAVRVCPVLLTVSDFCTHTTSSRRRT